MANHILIVCGYGCRITPKIAQYLNLAAELCNSRPRVRPDAIIFTGGFTEMKSSPGRSEAGIMKAFVAVQLIHPIRIYEETASLTTADNIKNSAALAARENLLSRSTKVTVFCEKRKAVAIRMLGLRFFGRKVKTRTVSMNLAPLWLEASATLLAFLGIIFPPVAAWFHNKRILRAEQS